DELYSAVKHAPSPTPCVFTLIMGAGMRSEDGHAILFDCLDEDPNDADFMLLTFWQSKVSKWNVKPLHKNNKDHAQIINAIEEQRSAVIKRHGKKTKYLFPVFNGTHESFTSPAYTMGEIKKQCVSTGVLSDDGSPLSFSWHPLRHTKGTSMAKDGHDILSIMMELGHASPDMATAYINNRLELKKKALLQNGGGRFYTIEGEVDESVANLLVRKGQIRATRVCGGACTMPAQIGDWCEHANACYTCKHYRADAKDVDFFKNEKGAVINLIEEQQEELVALQENQQSRMSEITGRRLAKNKEIYKRLNDIVSSIEADGQYQGREQQARKTSLEDK
ncbi:MAG: tyrosine-type recombinase/integrase, partial [Pseudomonadales bacterium]|nr:tyrosine-type recombinase/integrase [Pseudomonadales bacterium]